MYIIILIHRKALRCYLAIYSKAYYTGAVTLRISLDNNVI